MGEAEEGAEADRLFGEAGERYGAALAIKPNKHEALNNWGLALSDWARRKEAPRRTGCSGRRGRGTGGAGDQAGQARGAEYWGLALSDWALRKEGAEADRLFGEAGRGYGAALAIKPDKHEALNNWGNALSDWALRKEGAEADRRSGRRGRSS